MGKINKMRRAYLTDVTLDDIITHHIEKVTAPIMEWEINMNNPKPPVFVKQGKPAPRKSILEHKYKFLIHNIIMRCRASKENCIQMNYERYTSILGKHFGDMLRNLHDMSIISVDYSYTKGESSRSISLEDWNIAFKEDTNKVVIGYVNALKQTFKASIVRFTKQKQEKCFIEQYNKNLSKIELNKKQEALAYIESRKPSFKSEHAHQYYMSRIEDFDKKELTISSIDSNNRIYHYFTNLPKSLKRFFNIKYQLDIANSHPLLFAFYLIKEYRITPHITKALSSIINDRDVEYHNNGKQLRKALKTRGIPVPKAKLLPSDVLFYIYTTMKGVFWDGFMDMFGSVERGEVKQILFREVFYSHSTTTRKKPFAKKFVEVYPNVWSCIRKMKKDEREALPNKMMAFESKLFGTILKECFAKGWCVINIHDAIIVLDVPENESLEVEAVRDVMMAEYHKCGLFPTIKVDTFD